MVASSFFWSPPLDPQPVPLFPQVANLQPRAQSGDSFLLLNLASPYCTADFFFFTVVIRQKYAAFYSLQFLFFLLRDSPLEFPPLV